MDDEDLPANMEGMEREELQCVAASYGIDFDHKVRGLHYAVLHYAVLHKAFLHSVCRRT